METPCIIPYAPRPLQWRFHQQRTRFCVLLCHRRFGKTVAAVNDLLRAALRTSRTDWRAAYAAPYLGQAKALLEAGTGASRQTEEFVRAFAARDALGITVTLAGMEKWKRDQAIPEWQVWLQLLQSALSSHNGQQTVSPLARTLSAGRSSSELIGVITNLQKIIEYAQGNVSVAAICGYLQHALR